MPHTADPHGCARIWLLGFFGEFFMYVFSSLPMMPTLTCSEVFRASTPNMCCCRHKPCNRELSDWSGFSELRAEAASLNSAAAAGSHEKWMHETYGQDSVWINDEGMNPVRPGGVRLGARRRSIRPPSGVPTNQTLKKSRAVLKVNSESIQNAECLFSSRASGSPSQTRLTRTWFCNQLSSQGPPTLHCNNQTGSFGGAEVTHQSP